MRLRAVFAAALLAATPASGHELITAKSAQRYLGQAGKWQALAAASAPATERAEALYRIGVLLDEIRELLNRDLAAHGGPQGLSSGYLVAELLRQGVPLAWTEKQRQYAANTKYFEQALALAPRGPRAMDARFRLLRGHFYDSFVSDPLAADEPWPRLADQIALAEELAVRDLPGDAREEAEFIGAILYVRAALAAPDGEARRGYRSKARQAIADFEVRHPGSLRSAMMPVLRAALDRN